MTDGHISNHSNLIMTLKDDIDVLYNHVISIVMIIIGIIIIFTRIMRLMKLYQVREY